MHSRSTDCQRRPAGFSFLEVLVAVALSAMLLVAGTNLVVSFLQIWGQVETEPRFTEHVEGVQRFLQYCFDHSENLSGDPSMPLVWKNPPQASHPALHFRLSEANPLFVSNVRPQPPVDAYLRFHEDEGLSVLWHHEPSFTDNKLEIRRTPLSTWVEKVEYGSYKADEDQWEFKVATDGDRELYQHLPELVRLTFRQNNRLQTVTLSLSRPASNVTVY